MEALTSRKRWRRKERGHLSVLCRLDILVKQHSAPPRAECCNTIHFAVAYSAFNSLSVTHLWFLTGSPPSTGT